LLVLPGEISTGVPDAPSYGFAGWCGTAVLVRASLCRGEVSRRRSTSGIDGRWEGLNAKPSARTFVLVIVALTAANPLGGLAGRVQR